MKERLQKLEALFANADNCVMIGVDLGAGNSSAAMVSVTQKSGVRQLFFDSDGEVGNIYTAISYDENSTYLGEDAVQGGNGPFTNFKVPPDINAEEYFDGIEGNPTYRELMRRFFQGLIQKLFDSDSNLSGYKQVILFVGRPASDKWQRYADAYKELLTEELCIYKDDGTIYDGTIHVIIYSEAQAALAFEYTKGNIERGETVLIIDCGCSTFDAVLIKDREVIGEYSRQLGAGQIENLMYAKILSQDDEEILKDIEKRDQMIAEKSERLSTYGRGIHILNLRKKKEDYFGKNGNDGEREDLRYSRIKLDGKKLKQDIDEEFMEEILNHIPILVESSDMDVREDQVYESFVKATEIFIRETKEKICDAKDIQVNKVVLTGGASVMPFIGELIREVFGEETFSIERSREPAFSVGKGLAFMGYVENRKYKLLKNGIEAIEKEMEHQNEMLCEIITKAYADIGWQSLIDDLRIWKNSDRYGRSFEEGVYGSGMFYISRSVIQKNIRKYMKNVMGKNGLTLEANLTNVVRKTITELFGSISAFKFEEALSDVEKMIPIRKEYLFAKISYDPAVLLGNFINGKNLKKQLSYEERRRFFDVVEKRKDEICADLYQQLVGKVKNTDMVERLKHEITEKTKELLTEYLDEITPFIIDETEN